MNKEKYKQKAKEFYENMSDEEFKQRLVEAGFDIVENGEGKVIFTDEEE